VNCRFRHLPALGKAVQNAPYLGVGFLADDLQRVFPRIARMDDHRLARLARCPQMHTKPLLLHRLGIGAVVIIETRFPQSDHLGVCGEADQTLNRRLFTLMTARMDANRAPDVLILMSNLPYRRKILQVDGHIEKPPYSRIPRRLQGSRQTTLVPCEIQAIEMAMGIDDHASNLSAA